MLTMLRAVIDQPTPGYVFFVRSKIWALGRLRMVLRVLGFDRDEIDYRWVGEEACFVR